MKRFFALIAAFFVLCSSVSAVESGSSSSDENTSEVVSEIEAITSELHEKSPVADVSGEAGSSVPSDSEISDGGNTFYVLAPPAPSDGGNYGNLTDIPVGASIDNITFDLPNVKNVSDFTDTIKKPEQQRAFAVAIGDAIAGKKLNINRY